MRNQVEKEYTEKKKTLARNRRLILILFVVALFIGILAVWFFTVKEGERYLDSDHRDEPVPYH